jgi:hypothetical protein
MVDGADGARGRASTETLGLPAGDVGDPPLPPLLLQAAPPSSSEEPSTNDEASGEMQPPLLLPLSTAPMYSGCATRG